MLCQLKPRILAIDDDAAVGQLLRVIFEEAGDFTVEAETDPFLAIAVAWVFKPDLLIVDVNMPGRSGIELAAMIRKDPGLCESPILFFTGIEDTAPAAIRAATGGPAAFLLKGAPMTAIVETVERLVAERRHLYPARSVTTTPRLPAPRTLDARARASILSV